MESRQLNIVPTDRLYTYAVMQKNIMELKSRYPFLELGNIGYSVLGRTIPYIRIGTGPKHVMYSGSTHANEWIVSVLLMKFIEDFCYAYSSKSNIFGYDADDIFTNARIYIVPMVNPDGVDLVNGVISKNSELYQNIELIANEFLGIPFPSGWKANIRGVSFINFHFLVFKK